MGSSLGVYPAVETHLRLVHVDAAHELGDAAFGYAFRPLYRDTNLLPPSSISAGGKHVVRAGGDLHNRAGNPRLGRTSFLGYS